MSARWHLVTLAVGAACALAGCDRAAAHATSGSSQPVAAVSPTLEPPSEPPSEPGQESQAPQAAPALPSAPSSSEGERPERSLFLGEPEAGLLQALATERIARIEKGSGGRSLAFKITLESGVQGYFKPEQRFSGAHFYAELAAYYLDRELGIGRVPPTVGRRLPYEPLWEAARGDERRGELTVQEDGTVRGAFIWWIPERLARLDPGQGWERWVRLRGGIELTPFQRPIGWSSGHIVDNGPRREQPDRPDRPQELSDLILFDFLTTNVDRWGGNFTNVRTRERGGPLIYLDNGAGFSEGQEASIPVMTVRLRMVQRFSRALVGRVRALSFERLRARVAADPLGDTLSELQWEQLAGRRTELLTHVDAIRARFGAAVWY